MHNMNTILQPSAELLPWLTYTHFLTKKLQQQVGDAQLQVLDQHWIVPDWWDRFVLELTCAEVMHREISMMAWGKQCWYARTILPRETYQAAPDLFRRLETESLGNLIFYGDTIQRVSLIHYPIDKQSIEYYWLDESMHQQAPELWVRLSEFKHDALFSFFLVEIILPDLFVVLSERLK